MNNIISNRNLVIPSGKYNQIVLKGSTEILGNIECESLIASSHLTSEGNIKAKVLKLEGFSDINGSIDAEDCRISGTVRVNGDIDCNTFNNTGTLEVTNLSAYQIKTEGRLLVYESINAERFESMDSIIIHDFLNSEQIRISLTRPCYVSRIEGGTLEIKASNHIKKELLAGNLSRIDYIECDSIDITGVKCKSITGRNVYVGDYCQVNQVKYESLFETAENALVNRVEII